MLIKLIQLTDGTLASDARGVMVFLPDAEFNGTFVYWGNQAREFPVGAKLVEADSSDYPPTQNHYHFKVEYVFVNGLSAVAPQGQGMARLSILEDKVKDHTRAEWEDIIALADLGINPNDYSKKKELVDAAEDVLTAITGDEK